MWMPLFSLTMKTALSVLTLSKHVLQLLMHRIRSSWLTHMVRYFVFRVLQLLTPNQPEAELTLGMTVRTQADLEEAGQLLLRRSHAQGVLITRGSEGMSLFEAGKPSRHFPIYHLPYASEVVDTNGAGDTVAATFTLALTAGASMAEAAYLANVAAALVVRRLGCASNTPEEIMSVIHE